MNKNDKTMKGEMFLKISLDANRQIKDGIERIDAKINNLMVICAGVITVLFGVTYFFLEDKLPATNLFFKYGIYPLFLAGVFLFGSMIIGAYSYRPRSFHFMNPMDLIRELHKNDTTYAYSVSKSAGSISWIIEENINLVNDKANLFKVALGAMILAFFSILVGLIIMLWPTSVC